MTQEPGSNASSIVTNTPETWDSFTTNIKDSREALLNVQNTLFTVDAQTAKIVENFGGARSRVNEMAIGISNAASNILLLTDKAKTYEEAMAIAATKINETAIQTKRNYILNSQAIEQLVAAEEASQVASKDLIKNFSEQGYSLNTISENMQKVVNTTRALGVNTAAVSSSVVGNLSKLNTFNFANGIEGLTRMAAKAALFNIDMGKILQKADELFEPEKAVEMAASLQRLGVATGDLLDPLKLMDLGQNNPEELQKQIIEMSKRFTYFNEQNQKFEILPGAKRELREIAQVVGLNADELAKMALGSSTLADKMSKIRFPTLKTDITEDQKEMIANMSEMKDGKYMIQFQEYNEETKKYGEQVTKDVTQLTDEDMKSLQRQSVDNGKSLEETAKDQLSVLRGTANTIESILSSIRGGVATNKDVRETFEKGAKALMGPLKEAQTKGGFRTEKIRKKGEDIFGELSKINSLDEFKEKFEGLVGGVNTNFDEVFTKLFENFEKLSGNKLPNLSVDSTNIQNNGAQSNNTEPNLNIDQNNIQDNRTQSSSAYSPQSQTPEPINPLQRQVNDSFGIFQNIDDYNKLNNKQKPQSEGALLKNNSNNLNAINKVNVESNPIAVNSQSPIEVLHKFENINFNVNVDAPIGTNTALLTEVIDKALRDPNVLAKLTLNTQQMQNNYGITGGKVGEYISTAVV